MEERKAKVTIRPVTRTYNMSINGYLFTFEIPWRAEVGMHPLDILASDLQEMMAQLASMPRFHVEEPFTIPPKRDGASGVE